ncbi:hypothetical protein [Acinetobacter sp. TSRC1-2]|uniref:hypothetical protein n=1 Tax=unclassified Acinetobacter TaxID=196816 RepID=UPI003CF5EC96
MSTVSQKNRSIERPFCILKAKRKFSFSLCLGFFCLNSRYERIQSTALNEAQGGKAQLCIKKASVIKQRLFDLEIGT